MRANRNAPSRTAQIATMAAMASERGSGAPRADTARRMTVRKVALPARSKYHSVWRTHAGTNAAHCRTNARATQSAKTGTPTTAMPP